MQKKKGSRGSSGQRPRTTGGRNNRTKFNNKDKNFVGRKSDAFEEKDGSSVKYSSQNDWRWYATNEQLLKDAASYPYTYALGSKINLGEYGATANTGALAGVCALTFVPTFGYSDNPNSPINVASRQIYSDIRHTNSGAANYDPTDMMIYLAAMDSTYMIHEFAKRAYGVMRMVSPVNRYYPKAIIRAMGLDFDSLNENLADFRAAINTYAQKLKALVIPAGMSYMAKHQWMVTGLYQDSDTDKSQTYLFVPYAYYKFQLDEDSAGMLASVRWPGLSHTDTPVTYSELITFMNDLLDPLLANQDFTIMSGDILKWRGEGGVVVTTGITEDYQVFPSYDDSVLDQIQNATAIGVPGVTGATGGNAPRSASDFLELRQDATKSFLVSTPRFRGPSSWDGENQPGRNAYMVKRFVNFKHEHIEPQDTMEATRMCNIASDFEIGSGSYAWFKYTTIGSEVLTSFRIWYYIQYTEVPSGIERWDLQAHAYSVSEAIKMQLMSEGVTSAQFTGVMNSVKSTLQKIQALSTFDRHPMVAITAGLLDMNGQYESQYVRFSGYMNDINYYTIVDIQDLQQMSEVALMSMFNVRKMG